MSDRLPAITGKELVRALHRAGWETFHVRGSHHQLRHPMTQKKITVPVHAGQTLKRWLVQAILEDIGHSAEEFRKLL